MNRLDLIIDALQKAKDGWQCFDEYEKALAAARELQALDHVAWMKDKELTFKPPFRGHTEGWVKLYALYEVTK